MVDKVNKRIGSTALTAEQVPEFLNRELNPVVEKLRLLTSALLDRFLEGTGSPEGVVTADKAAVYLRQDGTAGTLLYVKTTDGSNTGWSAFA